VRYKEWGDADTHTFAKNANVWGTRLSACSTEKD
jgi:hypothetical protein